MVVRLERKMSVRRPLSVWFWKGTLYSSRTVHWTACALPEPYTTRYIAFIRRDIRSSIIDWRYTYSGHFKYLLAVFIASVSDLIRRKHR